MDIVRITLASILLMAPLSALCPAQPPATKPAPAPAPVERKKLQPGDDAPALKVAKWVKGSEIKGFEKGKIYVVDFWATWCGPCKTTMPHLSELAKKYKDKVEFLGVGIWEETRDKEGKPRDPMPGVEKFVTEMGDKASYALAYGGDQGEMEVTWMRAAERAGLPTAFIVDKEGRIAWIGLPLAIDEPLDQIVQGKFDPKAEQDRKKKEEESAKKLKELGTRYRNATQGGRPKELLDVTREALRTNPRGFQTLAGESFKRVMVNMNEPDLAYEFAKEFADGVGTTEQMWFDLNTIAWTILDDPGVKKRDIDLAFAMSKKSVEFTKEKNGALLDTLARAYWEKGDLAKAAEIQEKAVALAKDDTGIPDVTKKQMADALEKYKKGKK